MTQFDALCKRLPICDYQRRFYETPARPTKQDEALAWFVVQRKETPQKELLND